MEQVILNIKDSSKMSFLMQLIKQLDFVEIERVRKKKNSTKHDFFKSAGMWANRKINAEKLRSKAWDRSK